MQRYDLEDVRVHGEPWRVMIAHPDGEWVRHEDARQVEAERDEARREVERLRASIIAHRASIVAQTDECAADRELWAVARPPVTDTSPPRPEQWLEFDLSPIVGAMPKYHIPPEGVVLPGWPSDPEVQRSIIGHGIRRDETPVLRFFPDGQIDLIATYGRDGAHLYSETIVVPSMTLDGIDADAAQTEEEQ